APWASVAGDWWGGRPVAAMLPRLFFEHFADTSFAADRAGTLVGFLVGFLSQSRPGEAYIHFVGVHPSERGHGLGRRLYEAFFAAARARDCTVGRAVSAPGNTGSLPILPPGGVPGGAGAAGAGWRPGHGRLCGPGRGPRPLRQAPARLGRARPPPSSPAGRCQYCRRRREGVMRYALLIREDESAVTGQQERS